MLLKSSACALGLLLFASSPKQPEMYAGSMKESTGTTGTIAGIVVAKKTQDPLVACPVQIEGTTLGALTDVDGRYTILSVPPGVVAVSAKMVGYATVIKKDIAVESDQTSLVNFELEESEVLMEAVIVRGRAELIQMDQATTKLDKTGENLRMHPAPNVGDILKTQVGVTVRNERFHLRGGGESDDFNTENYDRIYENGYLSVTANPLSTFSIDVDAASYSNVRRFINDNQLPSKDAVRIEELINYFDYDYPSPKSKHPFAVTTELSSCPWQDDHLLLHIGLQGKRIPMEGLPPNNIVFLLDVSGSMDEPSKLPLLKSAFGLLIEQLREQDRVAIVVYAGAAGLVLPSTTGRDKNAIRGAIELLKAGGTTAGGAGIVLAYSVAQQNFIENGNNRVILATDGDFNVGVSSDAELVRMIEEKRRSGVYLTVLGFGTGNLKDSKLEQLADKGNGNYAYIDNLLEARKTLVSELGGTLFTIANDVKIQLEFNPAKVAAYRLIGYENRLLNREDFADDTKDAGELGAGHSVTALYEIIPVGVESSLTADSLKYQVVGIRPDAIGSPELLTISLRYKSPGDTTSQLMTEPVMAPEVAKGATSDNFRFAAAVAEFGMLLWDSEFKGSASYASVLSMARASRGEDSEGYRGEFIRLVESCGMLAQR
jgi:Ca-activated chloride channel family protein